MRIKAFERAKFEGLDKHKCLEDPTYKYFGKLQDYAVYKCAYYQCYKCKSPYFGGMKDCIQEQIA